MSNIPALTGISIAALLGFAAFAIAWATRRLRPRTPARPRLHVQVMRGDITRQHVDVIVNAAKPSLLGGGGVDGAIHFAGGPVILDECRKIAAELHPNGLPAGQAVITTGGRLPADWVVHTVGPVYDRHIDRSATLRDCYTSSLAAAEVVNARVVAFPLISSGVYGWPAHDALVQAMDALEGADTTVEIVRLVLFDEKTYQAANRLLHARRLLTARI